MKIYPKGFPLVFLIVFFLPQICLGDSALFFDQAGTTVPDYHLALYDSPRQNSLLGGQAHVQAQVGISTGDGLTAEKLHKYLGYAAVSLAVLTAVSGSDKDVHYAAAYGTVAASAGTLTTGYMAYGHRLSFEEGLFTEDNGHILLGTIGALGCIAAVALADSRGGDSHDKIGLVAGSAMAVSLITIKW